jgi:RHS repeat-associated protein
VLPAAQSEELAFHPPPVRVENRVWASGLKKPAAFGTFCSVSSTSHWDSWQIYDGTASGRLVGLDYFESRYFSSAQGRFTSPDDPIEGAYPENPQSFNRYSYALNNPLILNDPDGHDPCENGINPETGNICTVTTARAPVETVQSPGDLLTGVGIFAVNQIIDLSNLFASMSETIYGTGPAGSIRTPNIQGKNLGQQRGELIGGAAALLIPNPFGRRGGVLHQARVAQVEAQVEAKGLRAIREFKIDTPGGAKSARYVDVAGVDADGNVVELHQVGRATGGGQPVSRERQAIDDIKKASPQLPAPIFHPYNQ